MPLWLPWVAAPMFMLLPIVGCGAAASLRRHDVATEEYRPAGAARSVVAITRPAR